MKVNKQFLISKQTPNPAKVLAVSSITILSLLIIFLCILSGCERSDSTFSHSEKHPPVQNLLFRIRDTSKGGILYKITPQTRRYFTINSKENRDILKPS